MKINSVRVVSNFTDDTGVTKEIVLASIEWKNKIISLDAINWELLETFQKPIIESLGAQGRALSKG